MDVTLLCHCCLRGAPDRALTTPYTHLGKTETYADLLRDCFDINLVLVESGSSGICWACVGRLRDASDFKLQVQHSQAELQKSSLHIEYDVKSEPADDSEAEAAVDVLKEEPVEKSEIVDEEETRQLLQEQPVEESEIVDEEERSQKYEQPVEYIEIDDEEETSQELPEDPAIQLDSWDDITSDAGSSTAGLLHSEMLRSKYCTIIEEEGIKKYQCAICERTYRKWSLLRQHFLRCHLNLKKTTFPCSLCGEEIVPWTKARHLEQVHGVQPPTCKDCGKTFAFPNKLRRHQRIYHMGEKNYTCEQCGLRTATMYALKNHMYTYSTDRPFKCEFCSKAFKSPRDLGIHNRIHLNDKRFVCKVCDQAFVQSSNLRYHMNTRHPNSE